VGTPFRNKRITIKNAVIIDKIPNQETQGQRITKIGNSEYVLVPRKWSLFFDEEEITKILFKFQIPALHGIAHIQYTAMLVIGAKDFPLEKLMVK